MSRADDISIDVETVSLAPNAAIVSIGAVRFHRHTGLMLEKFYAVCDWRNDTGHKCHDTMDWWAGQSQAVQDALGFNGYGIAPPHPLRKALEQLNEFLAYDGEHFGGVIWQRGCMDQVWIEQAYHRCNLAPNFGFRNWQDQRTMTAEFGDNFELRERGMGNMAHNALDDAIYQAETLCDIFKQLKK